METEDAALPSSSLLEDKQDRDDVGQETAASEEDPIDWKAISLAVILSCLTGIEGLLVGISRWPYLLHSDPEVTSQYFGLATSVSKCFHAVFAFVFAYVTYKTREIRWSLCTGRILAILAGILYLSVELLPYAKRELLVVTYVLHEISGASMTVLRAWIAASSSTSDRTRAFASLILAIWISAMIGPLFQLVFTSLALPGLQLPFGLHLNLYTAPIYMGLTLNILSFAIIQMLTRKDKENLRPPRPFTISYKSLKSRVVAVLKMKLDWSLVVLCWLQKMIVLLPVVTLMTLTSPILMITQGWDGIKTVAVQSLTTTGVGAISICVTLFFLGCNCSKRVPPRIFYSFGLIVILVTYFSSYPFDMVSDAMPAYNETAGSGCNPSEYLWCFSGRTVSATAFISSTMFQTGLGLTTAQIALDGVYSRFIGHLDQNILQSVIVVAEDVVFVFGPSIATWIFAAYGQAVLWIVNGTIVSIGLLLWMCFSHKIKMV